MTATARDRLAEALLLRPELGAIVGLAAIWLLFAYLGGDSGFLTVEGAATYLDVAAQVGIIGSAITLLMLAGEFDISVGSMVGFAGMILAICVVTYELPLWLALLITFGIALAYGLAVGLLVVKTGLPSFLVTMGGLFLLRGLTIFVSRAIVGRPLVNGVRTAVEDDPLAVLFRSDHGSLVSIAVIWWLGLAVLATYIVSRTTFGNWILGTGGSAESARALGVPTDRVKIVLFAGTSLSAALLATVQVISVGSADALRGTGKEFEGIVTAVIGGTDLSGGYGSPIGTVIGALTLGIVKQGLFFAGVEADLYQALLGALLLVAIVVNLVVRRRATRSA
jgi:simple sugar transport system permease protein